MLKFLLLLSQSPIYSFFRWSSWDEFGWNSSTTSWEAGYRQWRRMGRRKVYFCSGSVLQCISIDHQKATDIPLQQEWPVCWPLSPVYTAFIRNPMPFFSNPTNSTKVERLFISIVNIPWFHQWQRSARVTGSKSGLSEWGAQRRWMFPIHRRLRKNQVLYRVDWYYA